MLDFTKSFYYFQIHTLRLSNELRSFLIKSTEKNKVKDKDAREEKWTKRIEGDNIIMDI